MTTREHARPRDELTHILRAYQGIEASAVAADAVDRLLARGWLRHRESYGTTLVEQAPGLRKNIATEIGQESIQKRLKNIRQNLEGCVEVIGSMTDEESYGTYLQCLAQANSEILVPMLATTWHLSSVPIMQARSANGVRIRILLAHPKLVARLRGESQRQTAIDAIHGWKDAFAGYSTVEIRIVTRLPDTYMATCLLIDDTILRLDVYDPHQHRSLQGTLVEFRSDHGTIWNVTRMFRRQFDDAWANATPTSTRGELAKVAKDWWQLWSAAGFAAAALAAYCVSSSTGMVLSSVLASAAGSFFVNWVVQSWRSIIDRLFKKGAV